MGDCIQKGSKEGWGVKMSVELNELKLPFNNEWGLTSIENPLFPEENNDVFQSKAYTLGYFFHNI